MDERTPTFGDNPIRLAGDDWLDRTAPAAALAALIQRPGVDLPLTIGVYGDWGSGKTSLLQLVRGGLAAEHLVFWFNAWAYAQQRDALWRALLLALIEAFRKPESQTRLLDDQALARLLSNQPEPQSDPRAELATQLERLETSLYRSHTYVSREGYDVNWQAAVLLVFRQVLRVLAPGSDTLLKGLAGQLVTGEDVKDLFAVLREREREELVEHVQSIDQFRHEFHALIARYINGTGRRLVCFIDDLDRCLPEDAVGVLEAIKIFFAPDDGQQLNCVFVLGMDRRIVEQGIRVRYANFALSERPALPVLDPGEYLDKIVQVPYGVPPLSTAQIDRFTRRWCSEYQQNLLPCVPFIAQGVAPNPRGVKRTLHTLSLVLDTRVRAGLVTPPERLNPLAKIIVIQTSYEHIFRELTRRPGLLYELERASLDSASPTDQTSSGLLAAHPRLREMLKLFPCFPADPKEAERLVNDLLYYHG
jgi:hypothetical protein